jgi:hypothetical protein
MRERQIKEISRANLVSDNMGNASGTRTLKDFSRSVDVDNATPIAEFSFGKSP